MKYKGYGLYGENGRVIVENVRDFDPAHVFECGQCFRWVGQDDGSYTGVAKGRVINVRYNGGTLEILNSTKEEFKSIWFEYFDLGRDYAEIKLRLARDEIMERAINFGHGIRILKQDLWETLISFIISANNRIPMIMKVIDAIAKLYGDKMEFGGKAYHTFPGIDRLAASNVEELKVCKGGFRCRYIIETARKIESGLADLKELEQKSTDDARAKLKKFPGVGNKVADCTLLYSGTKYDVFPTDLWVKRVMEKLYFKREASFKEIQDFARSYFGELAGFAQQYLFYYARENRIGAK